MPDPQLQPKDEGGRFEEFTAIRDQLDQQPDQITDTQLSQLADLSTQILRRRNEIVTANLPELEPINSGERDADFDASIRNAARLAESADPEHAEVLQEQIEAARGLLREIEDVRPFGILADPDRLTHTPLEIGYSASQHSLHDRGVAQSEMRHIGDPPSESLLVKGSRGEDGFQVYDVSGTYGHVRDVSALPESERVAVVHNGKRRLLGYQSSELSVFSGRSPQEDGTLEPLANISIPANSAFVAVNEGAGLLAVVSHEGPFVFSRPSVSLVDVGTENESAPKTIGRVMISAGYRVGKVEISRDGSTVGVSVAKNYGEGFVATIPVEKFREQGSGGLKRSIPIQEYKQAGTEHHSAGFTGQYFNYALSGDGKTVAAHNSGVVYITTENGSGTIYLANAFSRYDSGSLERIADLALNNDGSILAVSADGKLKLYSLHSGDGSAGAAEIAKREVGYPSELRFTDDGEELQWLGHEGVTRVRVS
jgi:hypothetical protein